MTFFKIIDSFFSLDHIVQTCYFNYSQYVPILRSLLLYKMFIPTFSSISKGLTMFKIYSQMERSIKVTSFEMS